MRARRKELVHDVDVGRAERDAHTSLLAARDALCQAAGTQQKRDSTHTNASHASQCSGDRPHLAAGARAQAQATALSAVCVRI